MTIFLIYYHAGSLAVAQTHLCKNSPTYGRVGSLSSAANGSLWDGMKYEVKPGVHILLRVKVGGAFLFSAPG